MNKKTVRGFSLNGSERFHPGEPEAVLRNTSVVEMEMGELKEGEILAETLYTAVCGSDVSATLGKPNFDWIERPKIIGHECSARVLELGPGNHGSLKVGDLFNPVAQLGCRKEDCAACRSGKWNLCPDKIILGYHGNGAFGQRMILESDRVVPFTEGLTPEFGAIVEPLSVVVNALYSKCNIKPGMDVLVTGCGIMGLMAAELAAASGARVVITGIEQDRNVRLKAAADRGITTVVVSEQKPLTALLHEGIRDQQGMLFGSKGKVDLLIECSGIPQVLAEAMLAVKPEHDVCLIATYPGKVELDATHVTRQSLNIKGVMGSHKEHFMIAQKLLVQGIFPASHYINLYDFEHINEAFADSIQAKTTKAVVKMN
ncbi:MAG: alcohol dehydrogenase catalytic domain-containing protein [Prevotellaceae bacterium]|jgi:threonine dehydrogenase-like Zn-dependent dehydrogenase|nr:alcohol dehydrogenase catalytic domain-containing protein [Prevotellaceae bacterium]